MVAPSRKGTRNEGNMNMRDPWLLIVIGVLCVVVPVWLSRWEGGHNAKPGGLRDRVQGLTRSEPATGYFIAGIRIGIEIAGIILIGVGVMRMLGVSG
jgi:hypothetical protein